MGLGHSTAFQLHGKYQSTQTQATIYMRRAVVDLQGIVWLAVMKSAVLFFYCLIW